ncbi:unnamed protein product [Cyprideis torosa]|uniref:Uncharacterized protein n=1 Tax=Cyprideis torosa TaxID=163714 RepID=A0A7R8WNI2_9CRUS|nr:unnamed protein product [Cyprideis torosa]CAG0899619.1 unnamed protein product [Cyprideis torosa]
MDIRRRKCFLEKEYPLEEFYIPYRFIKEGLKPFPGISTDGKELLNSYKALLAAGPQEENYKTFWQLLLWLEERQLELDVRNYEMHRQTLTRVHRGYYLMCLHVPGLAENRPSVLPGDRIVVHPSSQQGPGSRFRPAYMGTIRFIRELNLELEFGPDFYHDQSQTGAPACIRDDSGIGPGCLRD